MKTIDAKHVHDMIDEGDVILVDLLPAASFERRHLPGAVNLPVYHPEFDALADRRLPGRDARIVVYCEDGHCEETLKAASRLELLGYTRVYELRGGIVEWRARGYPLQGARVEAPPLENSWV